MVVVQTEKYFNFDFEYAAHRNRLQLSTVCQGTGFLARLL